MSQEAFPAVDPGAQHVFDKGEGKASMAACPGAVLTLTIRSPRLKWGGR